MRVGDERLHVLLMIDDYSRFLVGRVAERVTVCRTIGHGSRCVALIRTSRRESRAESEETYTGPR